MNDPPEEFGPTSDLPPQQPPFASALPYALAVPPKPPRVWTVFVLFSISLVVNLGISAVVVIVAMLVKYGPKGPPPDVDLLGTLLDSTTLQIIAGLNAFFMVGVTSLCARLSPVPLLQRLRLNSSGMSLFGYIAMFVGMIALSHALTLVTGILQIKPGESLEMLDRIFSDVRGWALVWTVLVVGLGTGFGEEFLFRGYIQTRLSGRWGSGIAVLIASALFGILHLDPVHSVLAFFIGVYLGFLAERTGSIRPVIVCHALNNMTVVLLTSQLEIELERSVEVGLLLILIAVIIASCYYVVRVTRGDSDVEDLPTPTMFD